MTISESEPGRGPNEKLDSAHVVCWPAIDTPSLEHANFPGHSDSAGIQVLMTRAPVKHLRQCGLLSSGGPTGPEGTAEIALGVLDRLEPGCTTRGGLLAERLSKNRPLSEPVRHSRHLSGAGRCRTLLYSFVTCESPFENVLLLRFNFQIVGDVSWPTIATALASTDRRSGCGVARSPEPVRVAVTFCYAIKLMT